MAMRMLQLALPFFLLAGYGRVRASGLLLVLPLALFACVLPARAADADARMCGEYQYTPLPGFITQHDPILPGAASVLLNMVPWRRTQKDLDTPTIYCRTEENMGDFGYKLPRKEELLVRSLAKQETRVILLPGLCGPTGKGEIYFLAYDWDNEHETRSGLVVIEINEPGNTYDSIFVVSPGNLDRDIDHDVPWFFNKDEHNEKKRARMCERAQTLLNTLEKR